MTNKKSATLMVLGGWLISCSGGGGGSSMPDITNEGDKSRSEWSKASPIDRMAVDTDLTGKEASIYTVGCSKAGKNDPVVIFDARLKPGSKQWSDVAITPNHAKTAAFAMETTDTILSVQNDTLKYSSIVNKIVGFPALTPGSQTQTVCTINGRDEEECKTTPSGDGPQMDICVVAPFLTQETQTQAATLKGGTFTFRDGKKVRAHISTQTSTGTIFCAQSGSIGKGEMVETSIKTNEVPSMTGHYCGGTEVYSDIKVVFQGEVVTRMLGETLSIQ